MIVRISLITGVLTIFETNIFAVNSYHLATHTYSFTFKLTLRWAFISKWMKTACSVELFVSILCSFKVVIADTVSSFKWRKIRFLMTYLMRWASITNNHIDRKGIPPGQGRGNTLPIYMVYQVSYLMSWASITNHFQWYFINIMNIIQNISCSYEIYKILRDKCSVNQRITFFR